MAAAAPRPLRHPRTAGWDVYLIELLFVLDQWSLIINAARLHAINHENQ